MLLQHMAVISMATQVPPFNPVNSDEIFKVLMDYLPPTTTQLTREQALQTMVYGSTTDRYPGRERKILEEMRMLCENLKAVRMWRKYRRLWKDALHSALQSDDTSF